MLKAGERQVVRCHNVSRRRLLIWAAILGVVAVFAAGYFVGAKTFGQAVAEKQLLEKQLAVLEGDSADLEQQLVNALMASEIDRLALQETRKEVVSLQEQLSKDEAELKLYRNLMQDDTLPDGLLVRELALRDLTNGEVAYRLVVQQNKSSLRPISVRVNVVIEGEINGIKKTFTLDALDDNLSSMPLELSFKYFDIQRGVIKLPAGFQPHVVRVEAWQEDKESRRVERLFGWRAVRSKS